MRNIEIFCENISKYRSYPLGTTLSEIASDLSIKLGYPVYGALVNNKTKELSYEIVKPKSVRFIDYTHPEGARMYLRSLIFTLYHAVSEVFPGKKLRLEHAISNGYYCEIEGLDREMSDEDVFALKEEILTLVREDLPFERRGMETIVAVKMLNDMGLDQKANLFEEKGNLYSYVYYLKDKVNHFFGHLVPNTGLLKLFDIELLHDGFILRLPDVDNPKQLAPFVNQEQLFAVFQEHKDWAEIHNISFVAQLNKCTDNGTIGDVIKISEALQERKIVEIASKVFDEKKKIVLIAGPSSSGKTTFSKRLAVQLAVSGLKPKMLSLDDYFVDREKTPLDENGEYDFEVLEAIDIEYFNRNLLDLLGGRKIELPRFDFKTGKRFFNGEFMEMDDDSILIIEGIHGLNPGLIPHIKKSKTFKIFISALTQINIDEHNYIPTTDNRLVRRIIRDSKYRNYSAADTIKRWMSVRRGENKNIFPYQENADEMFNSALIYELGVLKKYIEPLLKTINENEQEYTEAVRLLKFFSNIKRIDDYEIPPTSLIREFLGGSSFQY
ncbi:nucleoside kinase [Prolixibacteraceae bacterium JC049]|nr:nucleoside kinase [Prolixibacteraceae bacterium JC049]